VDQAIKPFVNSVKRKGGEDQALSNDLRTIQVFKPNHKQEKKGIKMKKLFIGSGIVFFMILTAGLASPAPPPICSATAPCSGNLYLDAVDGTSITTVEGVELTLTETPPQTGQPSNFWTGTLVFPGSSPLYPEVTGTTTVNISVIKSYEMNDDPHCFHNIAGTDGTYILVAEGRNNGFAVNPSSKSSKGQWGFGIRGQLYNVNGFTGSFHGVLFPPPAP
jgi:hypothetical protein